MEELGGLCCAECGRVITDFLRAQNNRGEQVCGNPCAPIQILAPINGPDEDSDVLRYIPQN